MTTLTSSTCTIPSILSKAEHGARASLSREGVFELNWPNYRERDILIDTLELEADPYDLAIRGNNVRARGTLGFDSASPIPELEWDHMSTTLYAIVINQGGKAAQNLVSTVNGIGLRKSSANIVKPAPLTDVRFGFEARVYVKMGHLWVRSAWEFFHGEAKVASFDMLSIGVQRDYEELQAKRSPGQ